MSKDLDEIVYTAKFLKEEHGKSSEQYVNIGLFEELLERGAHLLKANTLQVGGRYLHRALYQNILFISTSQNALKNPSFFYLN